MLSAILRPRCGPSTSRSITACRDTPGNESTDILDRHRYSIVDRRRLLKSNDRGRLGPGERRASVELFLISFLILFFELACIRWFGSTVIFLTFFTNIVLMACFLGVSVGCLASSRRWSWMSALVPLAIVATASACGFLWAYKPSTSS